jgi:hypothetical protein
MSLKGRNGMIDWEFIRAAQLEQRELEREHNVKVSFSLSLASPRSVIELRATAWEQTKDGAPRQLASYVREWPSASVEAFGAAIFQTFVQLTRLVQDSRRGDLFDVTRAE